MIKLPPLSPSLEREVQARLAHIKASPSAYKPYDLNGDGVIDASEEARLFAILAAQLRAEHARSDDPQVSALHTSTLIAQRYEILGELGAGGQARTYLALDTLHDTQVVIKQLHLTHLDNWKAIELFEREGQVLAQLDHPNIPSYLGATHEEHDASTHFMLIQEYIEGPTLAELIQGGMRFDDEELLHLLHSMLHILSYLHSKHPPVIHRDLKPSNMIRRHDGSWALIDFGAIQAVLTSASMIGSTIVGTSGYMAPEQFMGRSVPATDLYALGATTLHALSHVHPADLPLVRMKLDYHSRVHITGRLRDVLDSLLEPNVEDRPQSAQEVLDALSAPAPAPMVVIPPAKPVQESARVIPTLFVGLAMLIITTGGVFLTSREVPSRTSSSDLSAPSSASFLGKDAEDAFTKERVNAMEKTLTSKIAALPKVELVEVTPIPSYGPSGNLGITLRSDSPTDIEALKVDILGLDQEGEIVFAKTCDAVQTFEPTHRPGDLIRFDQRVTLTADVSALRFELVHAQASPSPGSYPPTQPVPIKWLGAKLEGVSFKAAARLQEKSELSYSAGKFAHKLELAVTHTGEADVQLLKLEKRLYSASGEVVVTHPSYVNTTTTPPFRPGETLLVSLNSHNHVDFERYEVLISDIRLAGKE